MQKATVPVKPDALGASTAMPAAEGKDKYISLEEVAPEVKETKKTSNTPAKFTSMTRDQYRNMLKKAGLAIHGDQDVLHIIAHANGGADCKENYFFVGNLSWNRSLGAKFDHVTAYLAGKEATALAVEASKALRGYSGPGAAELYAKGEEVFRGLRHDMRKSQKELK